MPETSKTLRERVNERIASATVEVQNQFVDAEAKKETASRVTALSEACAVMDKLYKELQKIDRPDVVNVDREGKPVGEGVFTKKRADQIKKTEEILAKWEAALGAAWDGDFKKLRELLKNPPKIEESKDE